MGTNLLRRGAMLVLCGWLASPASADDRPADKILAEIQAVEMPAIPVDRTDQAVVQDYLAKWRKAGERRATLIGELYKSHPEAPELAKLMPGRWFRTGLMTPAAANETRAEIEEILAKSKNEPLVLEAAAAKVRLAIQKAGRNAKPADLLSAVDEFIGRYPKDLRGAMMLTSIAGISKDEAQKAEIMKRLEKDYPDSPPVRRLAGERRMKEAVGKPFAIEFTDAIKGAQVDSASLKGKVVVVDFWATWCGPCVGEMPNMKKLYAEFKDKGVEFVGVSLDRPREDGGYDKLKEFVEKNKIEWPQYYEGKVSAGDFATNWGITGIPTVFILAADGNLHSTDARGKLEEMIPELLEKAKKDEAKP